MVRSNVGKQLFDTCCFDTEEYGEITDHVPKLIFIIFEAAAIIRRTEKKLVRMTDNQSVVPNLGCAVEFSALTDKDRTVLEASTNRVEVSGHSGSGQGAFNVGVLVLGVGGVPTGKG